MFKLFKGLFDSGERELKRLEQDVDEINRLEPQYELLSDAELPAKTDEFKTRLADGISVDEILPEAYAAVREAAKRTIKERHFDVQLMGGIVLHQGKIAEMKTGEGKTLVATLPLYLNALAGQGCHLITVNDYLARRDCRWMGPIYHALGVSVASINAQQTIGQPAPSYIYDPGYEAEDQRWNAVRPVARRQAYEADITYGTNNEFGFDYLRDNMVMDLSQCVQRPLNYAIVDEVDNILIDEARTPLIISGAAEEAARKYYTFAQLVARLSKDEDYTIDERTRTASLTDMGMTRIESMLRKEGLLKAPDLYDPSNYFLTQYLESALKARVLFRRDKDYMVKDGQVIIVDEFTGRLMFGRRYSEGLHQAIEAKERVKIQRESVTMATITFQNYFRLYQKLAGMTGTAVTEAEEFHKIYKLEVVVIPTNKPLRRTEHPDQIYKDEKAKFAAVAREIKQLHEQRRPVLIGTTSIEKSEHLADLLKRNGIPHQVLNAKHHEKEAAIIAEAGRLEAVTVATNMAGRGVDIILGGNPEKRDEAEWQEEHSKVVERGGLHIIGTEHHEARRIDHQLQGRAGRQGDPGSSRFYASLEDEIVRRFGGDRVKGLMQWAGMDENTPIEHPIVGRAMANAQVQTEGHNFSIRKHLVEYDDVINKHREVIYAERRRILSGADLKANIISMVQDEIRGLVARRLGNAGSDLGEEQSDLSGLLEDVSAILPLPPQFRNDGLVELDAGQVAEKLTDHAVQLYDQREQEMGADNMRMVERVVMLRVIDRLWMEHLTCMEEMRQGIGLRAVGQEQPLIVYKKEGHALFDALLAGIQHDVAGGIYHVGITREAPQKKEAVMVGKKVGRNDPCPCGSGKKHKHCCGK
ncbi:MAG: preprotein translocase subunit SecA [Dehalococcoidia bacterium]|nr:preprotein translocase subunit SecA [Dehalococcoidia bacterium]